MIRSIFFYFLILATVVTGCEKSNFKTNVLEFVDPMIGTDGHGHTFPGATTPFGMIQLSPSNGWKAWDWCSGYHYSDSIIKGFAHNHVSGAGLAGLGDILIMPTNGGLRLNAGTEENPEEGYRSRFSHTRENARAGYYSVLLDDYNILVELTASKRVGFHRYTFNESGVVDIIIDPTHSIMESVITTELEILSDTEIRGFKNSNGEAGKRTSYFYAQFSKPFKNSGLATHGKKSKSTKINNDDTRAWVSFDVDKGEEIEVKVALSFVSYDGARKNFDAEAKNVDFEMALANAEKSWHDKLSRFEIKGNKQQKRTFYTGVYHSFISPNIISDVDGNYIVEGKQYHSDFDQYSNFSTWDTFRALHPLFTIVEQSKTADFVNSLTSRYTVSKVGLPVWELLGHDNVCMIGFSATSPMADAIMKNIPGIDVENAYQAMKAAANSLEKHSPNYDVNGMEYYVKMGYIPGEVGCAVSKTVEQNYYDWAIAQVAGKLGKTNDAKVFEKRSKGFLNMYHPEQQFLWPKQLNGNWREMSFDTWDQLIRNYVSGNIWAYSAYTPHYMAGIIDKMGGRENYEKWLDDIMNDTTEIGGGMHVDISGFIGKYGHGDEPGHQMAYLYNYVGAAWKTQQLVHEITETMYSDQPDGLINNEDLGQMSAWYIFSTLGFYPVAPGSLQYVIGSPHFAEASIITEEGKRFTIKAPKASSVNKYIQSAKLNGVAYNLPFITHDDIMNGGVLEFKMGSEPSNWGSAEEVISQLAGNNIAKVTHDVEEEIVYMPFERDETNTFAKSRQIVLACNTPNIEIRYTLNGKNPTKLSTLYAGPITIDKNAELKAVAINTSGEVSAVFQKSYYKDILAGLDNNYPVVSLKNKPQQYGKEDGSLMFDGLLGSTNHNDNRWTGFTNNSFDVTIDLGKEIEISEITFGYLLSTRVWIFAPSEITVYSSENGRNFSKIAGVSIPTPEVDAEEIIKKIIPFKKHRTQYLRITAKNTIIPHWHFGVGNGSFLFVDEVFVN